MVIYGAYIRFWPTLHICFCLHLPCRCSTSMVLDYALAETIVVSSPRSLACVATIPGCPGAVSASLRHLYCVNQRARLHRSSVSIVAQLVLRELRNTFALHQFDNKAQHTCGLLWSKDTVVLGYFFCGLRQGTSGGLKNLWFARN